MRTNFLSLSETKAEAMGGGSEVFVIMIDEEEDVENIHQLIRGGISCPIDASYFKGQGLRQGIEREYIVERKTNDISESDRSPDGEQPSRKLLRTGCLHGYVRDGE